MCEADMQAVIQGPVSHLLRQSLNILGSQQQHHQAAAAANKQPTSAAAAPVVPVTRQEAVQLESRLQESLPAGGILATQQHHIAAWTRQQQQHWKQQLAVQAVVLQQYQQLLVVPQQQGVQEAAGSWQQCDVISQQVMPFYKVMDSLLKETAQQVAYHCVEHGRVLDNLRDRYAELANALYLSINHSSQQHIAVSGALSAAVAAATAAQATARTLQQQLAAKEAQAEHLQTELTTLRLKHDQLESESRGDIQQLNHQVLGLRQQLWQLRDEGEAQQSAAESAAAAAREEAERKLAAAEETNQNLMQRLSFLNAQMLALRQQQKPVAVIVHNSTQTDPPPPPSVDSDSDSAELLAESSSESELEEEEEEEPVKKTQKKMIDLLKYVKRGEVRSKLWVVKVIGQLYADKAVADAAADGQGQQRSGVAEFIVKWHLNRYGLKHLSNEALSDLLASACHYAAEGSRPAYWFAHLCGIAAAIPKPHGQQTWDREDVNATAAVTATPAVAEECQQASAIVAAAEADVLDQPSPQQLPESPTSSTAAAAKLDLELLLATPAAKDFYLFCCCQLAYPNSVLALFPEGEDALPLVRSSLVMETLKAVFRYLGDPDGQALFVARRLDAAAVAAPTSGSAAVVDITSSRPSTINKRAQNSRFITAAGTLRSNLADSSCSSSAVGVQPDRGLVTRTTINLRVAAADGAVGSSSSRYDRGNSSSSAGSGSSSIVGGFGYYSAWMLLDLLMSEWVDRVTANGLKMAELRRTVTSHRPSLYAQATAAATAVVDKPALLSKLQEARAALNRHLKPPQAAAVAAAELARRRQGKCIDVDDGDGDQEVADITATAGSSAEQKRRDELQPHVLVADATMVNAAAAWQAYQLLTLQIQAVRDRALRPPAALCAGQATEDEAAAADQAAEDDSQPVTAETAAAELQAAGQQGVVLSDALQQQLKELGLNMNADDSSSSSTQASASAAAVSSVGAAVMQDVLKPGGMASALQIARAKRAAAAAAAAAAYPQSGGSSGAS